MQVPASSDDDVRDLVDEARTIANSDVSISTHRGLDACVLQHQAILQRLLQAERDLSAQVARVTVVNSSHDGGAGQPRGDCGAQAAGSLAWQVSSTSVTAALSLYLPAAHLVLGVRLYMFLGNLNVAGSFCNTSCSPRVSESLSWTQPLPWPGTCRDLRIQTSANSPGFPQLSTLQPLSLAHGVWPPLYW